MKKLVEIALCIVTSVGGFLEIGSIATAAQAGADFSFQLIWAIVLGGLSHLYWQWLRSLCRSSEVADEF